MTVILDASVAIKWFLPEKYTDQAIDLLDSNHSFAVPDLFFIEIDSILTKRVRTKQIKTGRAEEIAITIRDKSFQVFEYNQMNKIAFRISIKYLISLYYAIYLALAVIKGSEMITADERLIRAVNGTPLESYVQFLNSSRQ